MKRPLALFVAAVLVALVGTSCSSTLSDAATINYKQKGSDTEQHVSRADLLSEVGKIVKNKPFAAWLKQNGFTVKSDLSADAKISAIWLSQLIHEQAIDSLYASRHLHVTPAIKASAAKDVKQIFPAAGIYEAFDAKFRATLADRQARTEAVLGSYTDTSDAAGQKFFAEHASSFACASGKNVAHILVPTAAAAQAIIDQLKAGSSFATLAQQKSTDTTSGARGGDLGCYATGQFVPAFDNAAKAAPFDTPVGPVHSKFGYHVILVTHPAATYEANKAQVRQALTQKGQADAQTAIDGLLKSFKVHVDSRFGKWGLVTTPQGQKVYEVSPPTAPSPSTSRNGSTTSTTSPGSP